MKMLKKHGQLQALRLAVWHQINHLEHTFYPKLHQCEGQVWQITQISSGFFEH